MLGPTRAVLQRELRDSGSPERLLSENGSPFALIGTGHLCDLAAWIQNLGIGFA